MLYDACANAITIKKSIVGQECKRLHNALRNQQTVEWVSMDKWKLRDASRVGRCYGQLDKIHLGQRAHQLGEVDTKIFRPRHP